MASSKRRALKCDRAETMRRVRSKNTSLEVSFRKKLWQKGIRYRLKSSLVGKPDLVFPGKRVAVFVDSCFWHGCAEHCRLPSSRQEYWLPKIERNKRRDIKVTEELVEQGWRVIRIWEHDIKACLDNLVSEVVAVVRYT